MKPNTPAIAAPHRLLAGRSCIGAVPILLLLWGCAADVERETPVLDDRTTPLEEIVVTGARARPASPGPREIADASVVHSMPNAPTEGRGEVDAQSAGRVDAYARVMQITPPPFQFTTAEVLTEAYPGFEPGGTHLVATDPVSTFSVDVDTAAYANVRRMLEDGVLPPHEAVRIEELINYFDYGYPKAEPGAGFALDAEVGPSPFHAGRELLRVAIAAETPDRDEAVGRNIVLLVDSSGSMRAPDKLPLLQRALALLVRQFDADDRISLVTYAGSAAIVLPPTSGDRHGEILGAIDGLAAGGGTHGSAGITTAYALARQAWIDGGANRVILATDGDFNIGVSDPDALETLIERERRSGIGLTVLGFGTGNYDDATAQRLAQKGNGIAAYIDSLQEARKVLVEELDAQLLSIGRDVKVQVEFNPRLVSEYRLLGYETRALNREDFDDDTVDAGDVGAGHQVTALYEIARPGSQGQRIRPLRYGDADTDAIRREPTFARAEELAHVRLRWLPAAGGAAREIALPVRLETVSDALASTSDDFRFSVAVAGFGEVLRGGRRSEAFDLAAVEAMARGARGSDPSGERSEFLGLVRLAAALAPPTRQLSARD